MLKVLDELVQIFFWCIMKSFGNDWNEFNEYWVPKNHFYFNVTSDFSFQKFQIKGFEMIWKWNIMGFLIHIYIIIWYQIFWVI
jgi:hypothetical protein